MNFHLLKDTQSGGDATCEKRDFWKLADRASLTRAISLVRQGRTRGIQPLGISKGEIAGAVTVRYNDGLIGAQSCGNGDYPSSTVDVALVSPAIDIEAGVTAIEERCCFFSLYCLRSQCAYTFGGKQCGESRNIEMQ